MFESIFFSFFGKYPPPPPPPLKRPHPVIFVEIKNLRGRFSSWIDDVVWLLYYELAKMFGEDFPLQST